MIDLGSENINLSFLFPNVTHQGFYCILYFLDIRFVFNTNSNTNTAREISQFLRDNLLSCVEVERVEMRRHVSQSCQTVGVEILVL